MLLQVLLNINSTIKILWSINKVLLPHLDPYNKVKVFFPIFEFRIGTDFIKRGNSCLSHPKELQGKRQIVLVLG